MPLSLSSTAFATGAAIPVAHTCDGADVSPPLAWTGTPRDAAALVLIVDDPDAPAGTWVHWVLYDLPPSYTALPAAVGAVASPPGLGGAVQGRNDFRRLGYGGPCPPPGKAHRYFFKLYALARKLALPAGATKADVERAMTDRVLARAELVGTYARRP